MTLKQKTIFIHLLGYLGILYFYMKSPIPYQKWIWFVWATNLFTSIFFIGFQSFYFAFRASKDARKVFRSLLLIVPVILGHLILGAFFSFFAQMEPLEYFGPNGYINRFSFVKLYETYQPAEYFFLFYLLTKVSYFYSADSFKLSGFPLIRDPFLTLIGCVAIPLLFLKYGVTKENLITYPYLFATLCGLVFIPWNLFFSQDVQSLIDDQVAHIKPNQMLFPMQIEARGAKGWGLIFALFGIIFMIVGLSLIQIIFANPTQNIFAIYLFGSLGILMFTAIGFLFFLVGLNLQWAQKSFLITDSSIETTQTALFPWPITKKWTQTLLDFNGPEKVVKRVRQSDGPAYNVYRVVLRKRKNTDSKNIILKPWLDRIYSNSEIVLYESYFANSVDEILHQFKSLFQSKK